MPVYLSRFRLSVVYPPPRRVTSVSYTPTSSSSPCTVVLTVPVLLRHILFVSVRCGASFAGRKRGDILKTHEIAKLRLRGLLGRLKCFNFVDKGIFHSGASRK